MYIYYLLAIIPVMILGLMCFLLKDVELAIKQWAVGSISAFIIAFLLHILTIHGMTKDTEIWTGSIMSATYYPPWVEEYQQSHHITDSKGRTISTYYTTEHANKDNYSEMDVNFGFGNIETISIDNNYFNKLSRVFDNTSSTTPYKSGFCSGDRNVYHTYVSKDICIPITIEKSFKNRVKASPSSFSFNPVPQNVPVFEYPYSGNIYRSSRLLGNAITKIDITKFDQLNARIGASKKGNVIIVGFNSADSKLGDYQRDKFLNGKKNDIVICYGIGTLESGITNVVWTKAFSWCKNEILLTNLEKMFKEEPIDDSILPKIENEIKVNFEKRNWSELDYIKIKPSSCWLWVYGIVQLIVQVILWLVIRENYNSGYY